MKAAIFFALMAVVCCASVVDRTNELSIEEAIERSNVTECIYRPEQKVFVCKGPISMIECPAVANFSTLDTKKFEVFGISKRSDAEKTSAELRHYWLYPRSINSTSYLNRSILVEDKWEDFVLYFGDKFTEFGIRVTDAKCYEKIVQLFDETKFEQVVKLDLNHGATTEVHMFAEAMIFEETMTTRARRWIGFNRFGVIPFRRFWPIVPFGMFPPVVSIVG